MQPEIIHIEDLKQDPANLRTQTLGSLGQAYRAQIQNGLVVAGHGIILAAKELGWKSVKARDVDTGAAFELSLEGF